MNTTLTVNTRTGEILATPCTAEERQLGGRAFIAHHLLGEVDPSCEPLGRKNRLVVAYDPRSLKGIGVMGADHTAGNALETARTHDPLSREGQVAISLRLQIRAAILDSLGVCLFIRPAFVKDPGLAARLLNARHGWGWTYRDVRNLGLECLRAEREFNQRAGVSEAQCDVPEDVF